jgi:UPF0755 protein
MTSETIDPKRPTEPGASTSPAAGGEPAEPTTPEAAKTVEPSTAADVPVAPPTAADVPPPARKPPKSPRAAIEPSEVPPPPTRSKAARNPTIVFLNGVFSLLTLLVVGLGALVVIGRQHFEAVGPSTEPIIVVIPNNSSPGGIADLLEKNGVVSDAWVFSLGTRLMKTADRLKAGEYEFPPAVSMREAMEIIVDGRTVPHRITFPEGWSSEQIVRRIEQEDKAMLPGRIAAIPEEGSLLPDTYSYARGTTTREQILDQMRKAQEKRLADVWAHRAEGLPLATPRDLVILASIVEKETAKADERPRVAAVFLNRLKRGMRLETDPTVLYGLYGGKAWLEGRTLGRNDLAAPNPYNTYRNAGLPPGPICNPGRAAMEAVANPSRTDELFFVADGTGGHVFASTLDEHNRNVQRWRAIEQARRASEAGAPANSVAGQPAATAPASGQPAADQAGRRSSTPAGRAVVAPPKTN